MSNCWKWCQTWAFPHFGGPEVKPGSSNMSSFEREDDLAPMGLSCSISCISDITEWDTELEQGAEAKPWSCGSHSRTWKVISLLIFKDSNASKKWILVCNLDSFLIFIPVFISAGLTSWFLNPFPVSQPAPSSFPQGYEASSPPSFCRSPTLCKPDASRPLCEVMWSEQWWGSAVTLISPSLKCVGVLTWTPLLVFWPRLPAPP